jgi:hypothetical protein
MTLYVTLAEAAAYIGTEIAGDDTEIELARRVASRDVENWCRRDFGVPTVATARSFVPVYGHELIKVPDIANTTGLVVADDGATLSASDYQLEVSPGDVNQTTLTGELWPWSWVRHLGGCWSSDGGRATVTITARWGWPATPSAVELSVLMLARDLFVARRATFGVQTYSQDGFTRRITSNVLVQELLSDYRAVETWGLA